MRVFDETGTAWSLGRRIATGAEGAVFQLAHHPELCVKLYHHLPLPTERLAKLELLRVLPEAVGGCAALPISRVSEEIGSTRWCGVLMPFVDGYDVYELYNPQGRRAHFKRATFEFVVAAALNLARAFDVLHGNSLVVGDISEQNIRVRPDATLSFIDVDSFQLSASGRIYPSNVGTPVWTPPELQGKSLVGAIRTRNHDRFGLAQLIFLLLFGGRYPFAGRPLSRQELSLEDAIANYAFAFDPTPLQPLLAPPLGAPSIGALPAIFLNLFLRAFRKGSEEADARPAPRDWADALGHLRGSLARCCTWENHVYWSGAKHCPWCDVLERTGFDHFPGKPIVHQRASSQTAAPPDAGLVLKQLQMLKPEPLHLSFNIESLLRERSGEAGAFKPAWWISVSKEMGAFGRFLRSASQRSISREVDETKRVVRGFAQRAAKLYLGYAGSLNALEKRAAMLFGKIESAASWPTRASKDFQSQRYNEARQRYLEGFLIRRFEIQGLTLGRKAALLSLNIVTAADVTLETVRAVPGFTEQLAQRLVRWRSDCERGFRDLESRGIPSTKMADASETAKQELEGLCQQGLACVKQWEITFGAYAKEHALLQSEYREVATRLALLEANLRTLR